ncbi:MAG: adaptor protein MecA [Eubacteriales bacterium]
MKFTKIDENTVTCVLSGEEMAAFDINLDDFLEKNKKVKDFMDLIISKAIDEVGYEGEGSAMQLQLQPLPNEGLAITITKGEFSLTDVAKMLKEKLGEDATKSLFDMQKKKKEKSSLFISRFSSLKEIGVFCKNIKDETLLETRVLVDESQKIYYFIVEKGDADLEEYAVICRKLGEYAEFESNHYSRLAFLEERNTWLMKEQASCILKQIYQ